jgi:hypothetical protein
MNAKERDLQRSGLLKTTTAILFLYVLAILSGCGGSGSPNSPVPAKPGATNVQVNLGDSPSNQTRSFGV